MHKMVMGYFVLLSSALTQPYNLSPSISKTIELHPLLSSHLCKPNLRLSKMGIIELKKAIISRSSSTISHRWAKSHLLKQEKLRKLGKIFSSFGKVLMSAKAGTGTINTTTNNKPNFGSRKQPLSNSACGPMMLAALQLYAHTLGQLPPLFIEVDSGPKSDFSVQLEPITQLSSVLWLFIALPNILITFPSGFYILAHIRSSDSHRFSSVLYPVPVIVLSINCLLIWQGDIYRRTFHCIPYLNKMIGNELWPDFKFRAVDKFDMEGFIFLIAMGVCLLLVPSLPLVLTFSDLNQVAVFLQAMFFSEPYFHTMKDIIAIFTLSWAAASVWFVVVVK